jgi:hypothetical protein
MWLLDQIDPGAATYNLFHTVDISDPLAPALLARSLDEVVRRQYADDALRQRLHLAGDTLAGEVWHLLPGGGQRNARSSGIIKWWHKEGREHGPRTYRPPA